MPAPVRYRSTAAVYDAGGPDCVIRRLQFPEGPRLRAKQGRLGRTSHHFYPTLELMTLVETGTRALLGGVFGPTGLGS
ncbi:hypothetical protein GCM10022384_63300 [Streptomyces marokkonensis]|uniref:Uncharacterized protein n=1 Tax=Streptomyces marokkonensis TaxID=324855 RepID=A0ABP7SAB1_9ACTN